ncbi:P-II family nitrogen regulator [Geosporobacter ferrireducens]|uniref:Nitrogen fixation protein n=1 Tax=Geosporobacter ferrireducens TaxID=1424294 RepID=A0A1D8GKI9_9FIRM|nr:P-II family nitrogen regulator [Geosporobacter ferrireducens]AOT71382.1 nitrogen fixation protein [Geosporobacter ferrireducens]MTI57685.1 P-II family nitrogen regulator [Geosporobacter ferrireducens]
MKEIIAVIRMNKVNQTKDALAEEGFPAFTCLKVSGRGKKKVDYQEIAEDLLKQKDIPNAVAEAVSEERRLLAKRLISLTVADQDAPKVIHTIININQTGNPGDGKIFVMSIGEAIRVRTGETGEQAIV